MKIDPKETESLGITIPMDLSVPLTPNERSLVLDRIPLHVIHGNFAYQITEQIEFHGVDSFPNLIQNAYKLHYEEKCSAQFTLQRVEEILCQEVKAALLKLPIQWAQIAKDGTLASELHIVFTCRSHLVQAYLPDDKTRPSNEKRFTLLKEVLPPDTRAYLDRLMTDNNYINRALFTHGDPWQGFHTLADPPTGGSIASFFWKIVIECLCGPDTWEDRYPADDVIGVSFEIGKAIGREINSSDEQDAIMVYLQEFIAWYFLKTWWPLFFRLSQHIHLKKRVDNIDSLRDNVVSMKCSSLWPTLLEKIWRPLATAMGADSLVFYYDIPLRFLTDTLQEITCESSNLAELSDIINLEDIVDNIMPILEKINLNYLLNNHIVNWGVGEKYECCICEYLENILGGNNLIDMFKENLETNYERLCMTLISDLAMIGATLQAFPRIILEGLSNYPFYNKDKNTTVFGLLKPFTNIIEEESLFVLQKAKKTSIYYEIKHEIYLIPAIINILSIKKTSTALINFFTLELVKYLDRY